MGPQKKKDLRNTDLLTVQYSKCPNQAHLHFGTVHNGLPAGAVSTA